MERDWIADLESRAALLDEMSGKLNHALRELHNERQQHEALIGTVDRIRSRLPVRVYLKIKSLLG